jgi:hypothetical protein
MENIFISHKRNVEPDSSLAAQVVESLRESGTTFLLIAP